MALWRRSGVLAAVAACAALSVGCGVAGTSSRGCTEIGSPAGVAVAVDRSVVVPALELTLRICQDDCVDRRVDLMPGSITVGETCSPETPEGSCSASSSPDGTLTGFVDLDTLKPGEVRIQGELSAGSTSSRLEEVTVMAEPTYPNGRDCPAGGPQAKVRVTASGLR